MFTPEPERESGAFQLRASGHHQAAECRRAIAWLAKMAVRCAEEDVEAQSRPALDYLERHIAKPVLVRRFVEALRINDRDFRMAAAHEALKSIARNAPRGDLDGK